MRVRVDHGADAIYVNLTDDAIKDSAEVADGIVVDYEAEGRIVGVEILEVLKRTDDPGVLKQFSVELPTFFNPVHRHRNAHRNAGRPLSSERLDKDQAGCTGLCGDVE